jgi:ferritin
MPTQEEKETLVIELYKQGKTRREIAKEVHMSFSPISDIIKRFEGVETKEENLLSKETKALKLFSSRGKDLVCIATKLDMKPEDVKRLYLEYLNLKGLDDLTKFYYEQGDQFLPFVQFYNYLRSKGISTLKVIGLAELVDKIPYVESNFKEKSDSIQGMLEQAQSIAKEIHRVQNIEAALQKNISWLDSISNNKQQEIQYLNNEIEKVKKQYEEMIGEYPIPSELSSQSVEWLSNRTGIDANRLQEMYKNGLRIASSMRVQ